MKWRLKREMFSAFLYPYLMYRKIQRGRQEEVPHL